VVATALVALCLGIAAGCSTWRVTRETLVDPIHELLHHEWPAVLRDDPEALAALFTSSEAAAPSRALRARFAEVTYAHGDLERMDLETLTGRVVLRLDGVAPDGSLRTVIEGRTVRVARDEGGFRIAADRPDPAREPARPSVAFVEEARLRGLWFEQRSGATPGPDGEPRRYVFASGVAASDLDGNGFDDVLLASGDRIELFLNEGGFFTRASASSSS
jgi:hypothetical protein